ncbi:MAG: hypothetical protein WEB04_00020 [Dehalococcoidia bacterium]
MQVAGVCGLVACHSTAGEFREMIAHEKLSADDLAQAHEAFEKNESRDLFYRAATEFVSLALDGKSSLTLAEALAVLLQTWNKSYYRFSPFDEKHFADIEAVLKEHRSALLQFRTQSISGLDRRDEGSVRDTFHSFEEVLGPVGAAKALHLLAPQFFPIWDTAIAKIYGCNLKRRGQNSENYWSFIEIVRAVCQGLAQTEPPGGNLLKAIDEYNYCKYTKGWI